MTDTYDDVVGLSDNEIALWASQLDDMERVRKATENRLRQITRTEPDSDGLVRGWGLGDEAEQVVNTTALLEGIVELEAEVEGWLEARMRRHPLSGWVKVQTGLGAKTVARLLGIIGDPYWHPVHERPRTVSELWAYCGMHTTPYEGVNVAPRRRRGVQANWSNEARMRVFIIADRCVATGKRGGSRYYRVYHDYRERHGDSVHPAPCVQCGEAGRPAAVGSPRKSGHLHAMGLRIVGKEVLKDLWIEARRIHEGVPHAWQMPGVLWLGG